MNTVEVGLLRRSVLCAAALSVACLLAGCPGDDDGDQPTNYYWTFTFFPDDGGDALPPQSVPLPWATTDDIASGSFNIAGYAFVVSRSGSDVGAVVTSPDGSTLELTEGTVASPTSVAGKFRLTDRSTFPEEVRTGTFTLQR